MKRKTLLITLAVALVGGAAAAVAAANANSLFRITPAIDAARAEDRQLAKAAFTDVLAKRSATLGMTPPLNLAGYAPIYPNGMIFQETMTDAGGSVEYAAAAPLRRTLDFYEDAAALHRMPFTVSADGPDTIVFRAGDGRRKVEARLTRQFENGTAVDVSYQ